MEMNAQLTSDAQDFERNIDANAGAGEEVPFFCTCRKSTGGSAPRVDSPGTTPPSALPVRGVGAKATLELFDKNYVPDLVASAGPRYFGFVTGGSTPSAKAGDWLVSAFDQNVASFADSSAPFIEREAIHWLAQLFGLSNHHTGTFVPGATMANFAGLAIARQWVAHRHGVDVSEEGLFSLPEIKIISASPHSCIFNALSMLGLGRKSLKLVDCLPDREAIAILERRKELQSCAASVKYSQCALHL